MTVRTAVRLAGLAVLFGVPYFFIKVALQDGVPPAFLAWARVTVAAALLLCLVGWPRALRVARARPRALLAYATVEISVPFPLIAFGEQRVSSSLTAILIATVPLLIALLAVRFDAEERVTGVRLAGLFVGFAGVVALVGLDLGNRDGLVGVAAVLAAAVGYALGPLVLRRHLGDLDGRAVTAVSLAIASALLLPTAALDRPSAVPSAEAVAAMLALAVLCTAAAFVLLVSLVREVGAGRTALVTYLAPIVAVTLGVLVLDEKVGPGLLIGSVLILTGSWMATRPARSASGGLLDADPQPGGRARGRGVRG